MKLRELLEHISDENPDREVLIEGPGGHLLGLFNSVDIREHVDGDKNYLVLFANFSETKKPKVARERDVWYSLVRQRNEAGRISWAHRLTEIEADDADDELLSAQQDSSITRLLRDAQGDDDSRLTPKQCKTIKDLARRAKALGRGCKALPEGPVYRFKVYPWGGSTRERALV